MSHKLPCKYATSAKIKPKIVLFVSFFFVNLTPKISINCLSFKEVFSLVISLNYIKYNKSNCVAKSNIVIIVIITSGNGIRHGKHRFKPTCWWLLVFFFKLRSKIKLSSFWLWQFLKCFKVCGRRMAHIILKSHSIMALAGKLDHTVNSNHLGLPTEHRSSVSAFSVITIIKCFSSWNCLFHLCDQASIFVEF